LTATELDYVAVRVSHVGKRMPGLVLPAPRRCRSTRRRAEGNPSGGVGEDRTCRNVRVGGRDWG
jgi:hypothetical protein